MTSDQFGFLCYNIKGKKEDKRYPYGRCLQETENSADFVAQCIYDTRTLGGAFVWPKVYTGGKWQSLYNTKRGVNSYIEDRVDLTLMEIKDFYSSYSKLNSDVDNAELIKKYKNERTSNILLKDNDKENICEWLRYFGSFENYVDFMCFNEFVTDINEGTDKEKEYIPLDITKSTLGEAVALNRDDTNEIAEMSVQQISEMLKFLRSITLERSRRMEAIIKPCKNNE